MRKKLSQIGNSLGIVIEKPILELLKIDKDTEFEVTTDGRGLYLQPLVARPISKEELNSSYEKVAKKYGRALKNLAK